jgi:stearoyl-CoA desaturase (delta-9 desaturase)
MCDYNTLHAVIANRYDVLARYTKAVKRTWSDEVERLQHWSPRDAELLKSLKRALVRIGYGSEADRARVAEALKPSKPLQVAVSMREELIALWERSSASKEQLLRQLQDWCHRAESSGIAPLMDFSRRLRSYA